MTIFLLIFGLLAFIGLVVVHEWGHFIAARKADVDVEEFGIGFPPKAKTVTVKNGTEYTLNWLPLGGFVRLKGEHDQDSRKGSFGAAKLSDKVKIMVAGVGMNLITAFILFTGVALVGMPQIVDNQFTVDSDSKVTTQRLYIGFVDEGSPADQGGLQQRDQLLYMTTKDGEQIVINSEQALPEATKRLSGQEVTVTYLRDGEQKTTNVTLLKSEEVEKSKNTDSPKGYLGVVPTEFTQKRSTWSAPVVAIGTMAQFTELTFKGLGTAISSLFQGDTAKATEQVAGPIGIFFVLKEGSSLGIAFILMIIAVISLTLAIMNILPIPALDGGRLFVTLLFRGLKKPLTPEMEDRIHGTGMLALMLLFVLITIVDVKRFF
jgi:regulator of sigma E protease